MNSGLSSRRSVASTVISTGSGDESHPFRDFETGGRSWNRSSASRHSFPSGDSNRGQRQARPRQVSFTEDEQVRIKREFKGRHIQMMALGIASFPSLLISF